MTEEEQRNALERFEKALAASKETRYLLRLFIAGNTPRSIEAIENIREICESQLHGRYNLEVIDIYQQPDLARQEQVIAIPTLIKALPLPLRKIIGDLSSKERILVGLNLQQTDPQDQPNREGDEHG